MMLLENLGFGNPIIEQNNSLSTWVVAHLCLTWEYLKTSPDRYTRSFNVSNQILFIKVLVFLNTTLCCE